MALSEDRRCVLGELANNLGYPFNDYDLLNKALTHRSYAHENSGPKVKDNERLEFLGDSVLDLIVARYLFIKKCNLREGDLSKVRSQVVNENSLAEISRTLKLGGYLLLGKGEESTGGRDKNSLLADAFEALIAAIYLDSSFETVYHVFIKELVKPIDNALSGATPFDYKGKLQKYLKFLEESNLQYRLVDESGPDHNKTFTIQVWIGGQPHGQGVGRTKKEAEQEAAGITYEALKSGKTSADREESQE